MKRSLLILALFCCMGWAQPSAGIARRFRSGSSLPLTCSFQNGDVFALTTGSGSTAYLCTSINTWGLMGFNNAALSSFNAFDQSTANGTNLVLSLNPATAWTGLIGMQESNNIGPGFSVGAYFPPTATNSAGSMPNVIGVFGEGDGFSTGTGTLAFLGGVEGLTELHSNSATAQSAFISYTRVDAGTTATTLADFITQGHVIVGTVLNNYGLLIADVVGGTTLNQSIHTGAGWVFHGDRVSIGSTATSPNNLLYVKGVNSGNVSMGWISDAATFGCVTFANTACAIANYFIGSDGTDLRLNSPTANVILTLNNAAKLTVAPTLITAALPLSVNSGASTLFRCTTAGTLRIGQLTTVSADCGASVDTGLRVN
jgi:hypothetical protein